MGKSQMKTQSTLTIGEVAKQSGVGIEAIRFYEREGILEAPPRRESGYREYSPEVVTRLAFIKRAQELGFSLKEISELLSLRLDPKKSCAEVKKRTEKKIGSIEEKIHDLRQMKKALEALVASCVGSNPIVDCPILEAFEKKKV